MQYLEEKQATLARITDKLESKSVLKELSNHLLVVVQRVLELDLEGEKTRSEAIFSSVLIRCVHDKNPTGILIIENYSSICTSERGKRCAEGDTCRCRIL
jgi:hypothetical protein